MKRLILIFITAALLNTLCGCKKTDKDIKDVPSDGNISSDGELVESDGNNTENKGTELPFVPKK